MRALLFLLCLGFVPPKREVSVEIAGVYVANGTHPDGSTYQGRATLNKLSSDRYEIIFDMPSGVFRALCIRVREVLGCGWGSGNDLTVAMFDGGSGVWTSDTSIVVAPAGKDAVVIPHLRGVMRVKWTRGSTTLDGWGILASPFIVAGFPSFRAGAAFYRIGPNGTTLIGDWMDPNMPDSGIGTETLTR